MYFLKIYANNPLSIKYINVVSGIYKHLQIQSNSITAYR